MGGASSSVPARTAYTPMIRILAAPSTTDVFACLYRGGWDGLGVRGEADQAVRGGLTPPAPPGLRAPVSGLQGGLFCRCQLSKSSPS